MDNLRALACLEGLFVLVSVPEVHLSIRHKHDMLISWNTVSWNKTFCLGLHKSQNSCSSQEPRFLFFKRSKILVLVQSEGQGPKDSETILGNLKKQAAEQ